MLVLLVGAGLALFLRVPERKFEAPIVID